MEVIGSAVGGWRANCAAVKYAAWEQNQKDAFFEAKSIKMFKPGCYLFQLVP